MDRKGEVIFALTILAFTVMSSCVFAEENESQDIAKAYDWLNAKTENSTDWSSMTTKQNAFSLLALGCNLDNESIESDSLYAKAFKSSYLCWGEKKASTLADCKITETALAKLAADKLSLFDTEDADEWLLNQSRFFDGLYWFVELDVNRELTAGCEIIYDGGSTKVKINENKTLSGLTQTGTACFKIYDNYWLQIEKACYEKSFKVTCNVSDTNENFRTTPKYKKSLGDTTWYVSPDSWTDKSGQSREFALESYCLAKNGICDYEGTAWASYALKGNEEVEKFIPYLIIEKENNEKYLPEAFLYIGGVSKYGDSVEKLQNAQGFWKAVGTVYGQFYDTALAGITQLGALSNEKGGARYYLVQDSSKARTFIETSDKKYMYWKCAEPGCEALRDTAFLLWVYWPEYCSGNGGAANNNTCASQGSCKESCLPNELPLDLLNSTCAAGLRCCQMGIAGTCEQQGGSCTESTSCLSGEFQVSNVACSSSASICCKKNSDAACSEFGETCTEDEQCMTSMVKDKDGYDCCPGMCVPKNTDQTCFDLGGRECFEGQACLKESPWGTVDFITSNDTSKCCLGDRCLDDESCSEKGGMVCSSGQCSVSTVESSDQQYCCTGTCGTTPPIKPHKSKFWLWLLIIVLIIAIILYFVKFRKKKKKPVVSQQGFGSSSMMMPPRRPLMPLTPLNAPVTRPMKPTTLPPLKALRPIPIPQKTSSPPKQQRQLRPMVQINVPGKVSISQPKSKKPVAKKMSASATETELDKTLKKLKGMTAKKK